MLVAGNSDSHQGAVNVMVTEGGADHVLRCHHVGPQCDTETAIPTCELTAIPKQQSHQGPLELGESAHDRKHQVRQWGFLPREDQVFS